MRGAYGVQTPLGVCHIAILDDVVTTGSTAAEVATVLRQAGAERFDRWAQARTPRSRANRYSDRAVVWRESDRMDVDVKPTGIFSPVVRA